jgi:Ser/Thr protein kinase RdoA (MazF antagonist)
MTKHGSFKKVVRRHAQETGQNYTEALTNLEGIQERLFHEPAADHLIEHLQNRYNIEITAATKTSQHNDHVFRIDIRESHPWIARVFPPARPKSAVDGDAAILRFLENQDYPAERLAADPAVSGFENSSVLVTRFVNGEQLPASTEKNRMMGDLLGRLHALTPGDSVTRPGGAGGEDSRHAGNPKQDLLAALSFLDAVSTKITAPYRERFETLREQVRTADDGSGLPEALVHGNLLHNPDHALLTNHGPVAINVKSAGIGPRIADLANLMWGATWSGPEGVTTAADAYRNHIQLTDEELERFESVMYIRPLYYTCFDYRRSVESGHQPDGTEPWWGFIDPDHLKKASTSTRTALRR